MNKIFKKIKILKKVKFLLFPFYNRLEIKKIFQIFEKDQPKNKRVAMFVGGCVRKHLLKEEVDDIDIATIFNPNEIKKKFSNTDVKVVETGIEHGTITAIIDNYKYEITSLRKDVTTDGRHAKVEFSLDWKEDAARRDFSINSIYSDEKGNLFDPNNGKKDLEDGTINFIGDIENRIKEDYLRVLRYIRFFLNYSNQKHNPKTIKIIKRNISGISKLSSERLLDEFKKLTKSIGFIKLFSDKNSLEIIEIIFPQLKNLAKFKELNSYANDNLFKIDFIFLLSLMIIDGTDNTEYFLYKFNVSKKDQKRLKLINHFYKEKVNIKNFTEKNFNKFFYFNGKQAVIDIINFRLFMSKKVEKKLIKLMENYKNKVIPSMPIGANILMTKYNIPEGKILGNKLKMIEEIWVKNSFNISEKQIQKIVKG